MKKKKVLFIDRDGTLIREPEDEQIDSFEKLEFYPGVFGYLGRIAREGDYHLVMVTNQDGLGTEAFPETDFWPVQHFILRCFEQEGIKFEEVHIDRTFPEDKAPTRKPGTGMLQAYFGSQFDLEGSYVIGDRLTDMELARNLGCKGIFINTQTNLGLGEVMLAFFCRAAAESLVGGPGPLPEVPGRGSTSCWETLPGKLPIPGKLQKRIFRLR